MGTRFKQIKQIQEEIYLLYKEQNRGWECYSDEIGDLAKLQKQLDQIIDSQNIRDTLIQMNIKSGKYFGLLQDDNTSFKNVQRISLQLFEKNNYEKELDEYKMSDILTNIKNNIQKIFELEQLDEKNDKDVQDLSFELYTCTIIGIIILDSI